MFAWLAGRAPGRRLAWDCATGNGQAACDLTLFFERVLATDASREQLQHATLHPRVTYALTRAEASAVRDSVVELATVAQAVHWFELDLFFREARRVMVPGGVLALWCYGRFTLHGDIGRVLDDFYDHSVGPYWPARRALVEDGYASFEFPFEELRAPEFAIQSELTRDELLGYVRTWSAVAEFRRQRGHDPLLELEQCLAPLWPAQARQLVRWPIRGRFGRV